MFVLDERLQKDTVFIGRLPLCHVLLMNDKRFPWVILVPAYPDLFEIYHLSKKERAQFIEESSWVSEKLADFYSADSMNIATLGNVVPQLHMHCVVRQSADAAWPKPVWGFESPTPYTQEELTDVVNAVSTLLESHFIDDEDSSQYVPDSTVYW